jgi:hypothetical protein
MGGGGTTNVNDGYPYGNNGLTARQFTKSAQAPSQPWCSSKENIANGQFMTYGGFPAFPTPTPANLTFFLWGSANSFKYTGQTPFLLKIANHTLVYPSNDKFLGMCGAIFSPNKYFMLLQQDDGNVCVWDVSSKKLPLKVKCSGTNATESTWEGIGNQVSKGTWKPAYHFATFHSGVKVQKIVNGLSTTIATLFNSKFIPSAVVALGNDGGVFQAKLENWDFTEVTYSFNNVTTFAPIKWSNGLSGERCLSDTSGKISFDSCNGRISTQQWIVKNNQVYTNQVDTKARKCLDGNMTNPINTCDPSKKSQKWNWVCGYLQYLGGTGFNCLQADTTSGSNGWKIGPCLSGPPLAWNL